MSDMEIYFGGMESVSPLEGREVLFSKGLDQYFSEAALHRYRAVVEVENLIALSESGLEGFPSVDNDLRRRLRDAVSRDGFNHFAVAEYDHFGRRGVGPFEHDVKSVEIYLREFFGVGEERLKELVHFPMTSEDVNNIVYNLMLRDGINGAWLPNLLDVCDRLADLSGKYAEVPVVGKTHGMNASPTTIGKRFAYHLDKFASVLSDLRDFRLKSKFSGPVGNHNAMAVIAPDFDFEAYAKSFVEGFGFEYSPVENQRISHQSQVKLFNLVQEANLFGKDLAENMRHQIMVGWLYLEGNPSHVGSSVMPQKINPWVIEVAQGYFEVSDALINSARDGLIQSVLERDLTDHPWERMYGEMVGYSHVAFSYINKGLPMVAVDKKKCLDSLEIAPEVISEAIQLGGRLSGMGDAYMRLKEITRGKKVTLGDLRLVIEEGFPEGDIKNRLLVLVPEKYIGKAAELAYRTQADYIELRREVSEGVLGVKNNE